MSHSGSRCTDFDGLGPLCSCNWWLRRIELRKKLPKSYRIPTEKLPKIFHFTLHEIADDDIASQCLSAIIGVAISGWPITVEISMTEHESGAGLLDYLLPKVPKLCVAGRYL